MSRIVRRGDSFSFPSSSGMSKNSSDRSHRPPRFSLRRFFCRRPSTARSMARAVQSQSEIESQSVSSLQASFSEREISGKSSAEDSHVVYKKSKDGMECPVCLTCQPKENFPVIMTCHHRSCVDCLRKYLRIEITESRVNIACPECNEKFHPNDIKMILDDDELLLKYEEFMLRRVLVLDPDTRWCPAPDCGYAVIASGCASCPRIKCEMPGCNTYFCYHCKQYWHPNQTCDTARAERSSNLRSSSISYSHESGSQNDIKPCPRCSAFIVKMDDGSCNHMTCAVCGAEFCWLCMKEISDLHYLSPSGCTFWGKKPWSRKKKILWQLGTLVGAPVGITLIAGIAVPAIIIGVPVWVGKRLHSRCDYLPKHRRNLIVASGVIASILVSPILAGLAVGIGVPILLAYVYGVVPISLCRSGGCGVTTTNSGGVRFDFDDNENGPQGANTLSPGADAQSMETNIHNVANPSIGPSIGEMSMAMTNSLLSASGSHLDRVGMLRDDMDRESASNKAMNGSVSSSVVTGTGAYHNRLEIQADVSTQPAHKRNSISSESANFSLDAKSATVSFGDDASTKALAGSLCCRDRDGSSAVIPPLEIQVDVGSTAAHYHGESNKPRDEISGKAHSGQDSPSSNHNVNFVVGEVSGLIGPLNSNHAYASHNTGILNDLCEEAEEVRANPSTSISFVDNISVGNCSQNYEAFGNSGDVESYEASSPESSGFTVENLTCHQIAAPLATFTEVESDRPAYESVFAVTDLKRDSSSESTSPGIISILQKGTAVVPEATPQQIEQFAVEDDDSLTPSMPEIRSPVTVDHSSSDSMGSGVCETTVLIDGVSTSSSSSCILR